jgi:hypothetical protein
LGRYFTGLKVAGSIPNEVLAFFNSPNPSNQYMALGFLQKYVPGIFLGGEMRLARKAGNLL